MCKLFATKQFAGFAKFFADIAAPFHTEIVTCTTLTIVLVINSYMYNPHYSTRIYPIIVMPGSTELITLRQMLSYNALPWVLCKSFHGFCLSRMSIRRFEGVVDTLVLVYSLHTSLESFSKLTRK